MLVQKLSHSYMHCWRHKTPVIYRATSQWFAGMDVKPRDGGPSLRESALAGIDATAFYPPGAARLHAMIANRPDWTLSRQRQWGVPMAFFVHKETGELHPRTVELLEQIAQRVEKGGIEAWQSLDPRELLGDEAELYEKNRDTLDVWFDSGSTHATVLGGKDGVLGGSHGAELAWPADLYLEGSDQHRGWFHSSLLTGCMLYGHPLQGPAHARLRGRRPGPQDEQVGRQRHRAAESVRFARRRDPAPVGRLHRLLGRAVDLRRDPQARGRKLSPHPQHAALPAGQRGRLRRGRPGRAVWRAVRNRPLRAGDDRADAGRSPGPLRTLRFPSRRLPPADVLLGRPRRVLPGHPERPPVHDGCRQRRAPFGADRVARHHPDAAQADGAHPLVHRRGSLEDPGRLGAGQAGRRPARHHLHRGLSRVAAICRRRGPDRQVDAPARHPRGGAAQAGRGAFGRRHRLVAAGRSGPVRQRGRPRHPGQPGR